MRTSDVLPAPLGPSSAKISPRWTANETPATARTLAYVLVPSWTERIDKTGPRISDSDPGASGGVSPLVHLLKNQGTYAPARRLSPILALLLAPVRPDHPDTGGTRSPQPRL